MTRNTLIILGLLLILLGCNRNKTTRVDIVKNNHSHSLEIDSFEFLRPSVWVYGIMEEKDRQRQIVDDWYKFRFRIIAGCIITDSLRIASDNHNKTTDSILTVRIGKNWREKFEHTVDSLYSVDSLAIEIAKADRYISIFHTAIEEYNDQYKFYPNLQYKAFATTDNNIRIVVVEGYGIVYNKVGRLNYIRATIDLKRKKVINIDKTAYGE